MPHDEHRNERTVGQPGDPHTEPSDRTPGDPAHLDYRDLFVNAPVAYLVLHADGHIRDANTASGKLLGQPPELLIGRHLSRFMSEAARRDYQALLHAALRTPGSYSAELALQLPDDRALHVELNLTSSEAGGQPLLRVTLHDGTQQRQAQVLLLDTNEQLEQQVQARTAKLYELNDEFDRIVQATASEMHDDVYRARGFLDLLRRDIGTQDPTTGRHFEAARASLEHAAQSTRALLGYARATRTRARLRDVDLNVVLHEVRKDLEVCLEGREVQFGSVELPIVRGDAQAWQVILTELLSNAVKFTREREAAVIRVLAHENDTEFVLGVQDNGVGFNMRSKDKLFQVFARLHPSGSYEGAGVGLAVVRRLCARFGGRVWAEGKVGDGATFWVAWPKEPQLLE